MERTIEEIINLKLDGFTLPQHEEKRFQLYYDSIK